MRLALSAATALAGIALLAGCAREHNQTKAPNTRTITFTQGGVSLVVGEEWQDDLPDTERSLRPRRLVGPAGVIRLILLPPDRNDPRIVAESLRSSFEANRQAARHSFKKREFVSKDGAQGICVSYSLLDERDGVSSEVPSFHFLVKNRGGRCVVINYVASAGSDVDAVQRMIRNTLAMQ